MHPLLKLMATQPRLLAEHAQAYAQLVALEIDNVSSAWRRRTLLQAAALCCLGVASVLAGVAWMLWAVVPGVAATAAWALLGAPLLPLAAGLWCLHLAHAQPAVCAFDSLRQQIRLDLTLLREAGAT